MKNLFKSLLIITVTVSVFSCKEDPIEKPDSLTPVVLTIADINTGNYKDQTVTLEDVFFVDNSGKFNDSGSNSGGNRDLSDCDGNVVILFTYSTDDWAFEDVPDGLGPVTGVVSEYNGVIQFLLRSIDDVAEMTGPLCNASASCTSGYFCDDFESGSVSKWLNKNVSGSVNWSAGDLFPEFGTYYGQIKNWNGSSNDACETWLISPSIDLSAATAPKLSFQSAYKYTGDIMEVYVSTSYDGSSSPVVSNWTKLTPTLSPGDFTWTASGDVDLSAYKNSNTRIAFRYTGSASDGSTWEIDDVLIQE